MYGLFLYLILTCDVVCQNSLLATVLVTSVLSCHLAFTKSNKASAILTSQINTSILGGKGKQKNSVNEERDVHLTKTD